MAFPRAPLGAPRARRAILTALALGSCFCGGRAEATECRPDNGYSPCIEANPGSRPTGAAHFLTFGAPRILAPGAVAIAVGTTQLWGPLELSVPGPDSSGRQVRLVDRSLDFDILLAWGLGRSFELGLATGMSLSRTGAGVEGITASRAQPLDGSAPRDLRVSLARGLALRPTPAADGTPAAPSRFAAKPRLELSLPLGDRDAFASSGAPALALASNVQGDVGRFRWGGELGAKWLRSVELGSARLGSRAWLGLGLSVRLLSDNRLWFSGEAQVGAPLVSSSSARARDAGIRLWLFPAEWVLSARSQPSPAIPLSVAVGAGSALALSREEHAGASRYFAAPGTAGLRIFTELRYTPED